MISRLERNRLLGWTKMLGTPITQAATCFRSLWTLCFRGCAVGQVLGPQHDKRSSPGAARSSLLGRRLVQLHFLGHCSCNVSGALTAFGPELGICIDTDKKKAQLRVQVMALQL